MDGDRVNFSQRFLALMALGYLIAVGISALAVWWTTAPVLQDWQDRTIREQAEAHANSVRIILQEMGLKTQILATNNDIVKVTIGDEEDLARASDQVRSFTALDDVVSVNIFDFSGRLLLREADFTQDDPRFTSLDHARLARNLLEEPEPTYRFAFRPGEGEDDNHFLIAQPIRQNGLVEGVLVTEASADMSRVFATKVSVGTAGMATQFQHDLLFDASVQNTISARVPDTDFYVVFRADRDLAAAAGDGLVDTVLYAVGVFLVIPFCVTAIAGLRSLVAPHRALEESQAALKSNQKKLSELADIAERSNDVIIATDLQGRMTWVNRAFEDVTGFAPDDVLGQTPGEVLQGPDTDRAETRKIGAALDARRPIRVELLNYTKSGRPYWNAISISPQVDEEGNTYGFVAISADVTEKREAHNRILEAKAQVEHQANHDPLTGLPNRRALDVELEKLRQGDIARVLVRIDLDHFKTVNDTLGHAAGDHVLTVVSDLLRSRMSSDDLVARVGGDEFVLLMGEATSMDTAMALVEELLVDIRKDIEFEGKACRIGASFGVASTENGLIGNSDLLLGADAALYEAKDKGRNRVVAYTKTLHDEVVASRVVAKDVERGILRREFEPFFQPQLSTADFSIVGVETLARWRHPQRGVLGPESFMQYVDQLSVAGDLDALVMESGLEAMSTLNKTGRAVPKISFNVDSKRFEEPDLPELIHQTSFEGTKVSFEVLESVLVEEQSDLFNANVELLRALGFGIEIDDFGSGHASIVGLTRLAPDTMKIDKELVLPIVESVAARRLVSAVVEIGQALGIEITAEGVESAAHATMLCNAGCHALQGFFFAPPMALQDLMDFIDAHDPEAVAREIAFSSNRGSSHGQNGDWTSISA